MLAVVNTTDLIALLVSHPKNKSLQRETTTAYAFGVSFLHSQISIDDQVLLVALPRSVESKLIKLRLELEIESHSKCNRLLTT